MALARIGIGSNSGNSPARVLRAMVALSRLGTVTSRSALYRSKPWGRSQQSDFINAAVLLETELSPHRLLDALKDIEAQLGRQPTYRWGPRTIDLDILAYDNLQLCDPRLTLPHAHLFERAFALVPLAEIEERYVPFRNALPASALDEVTALARRGSNLTREPAIGGRKNKQLMNQNASTEPQLALSRPVASRLHALAKAFIQSDLVRLRVSDQEAEFEMSRAAAREHIVEQVRAGRNGAADLTPEPKNYDFVTSDIVGIVHLTRPIVAERSVLEGDRELAYVEALGIRNSVRSRGAGRIVEVLCKDGDAVDYGRPLFAIDRTI